MTTTEITNILKTYIQSLSAIDATNPNEYEVAFEEVRKQMLTTFGQLSIEDAAVYPFNLKEITASTNWEHIAQKAATRYTLPYLHYAAYRDTIQGEAFITPKYLKWQTPDHRQKNIVINHNTESKTKAIDILNQIVMSILLAFPIKKVHINILNLQMTQDLGLLSSQLDDSICSLIIDDAGVRKLCARLQNDMLDDMKTFSGTQEQYNEEQKDIVGPYEIILIPNYPSPIYNNLHETLLPIFQNGSNSGLYFILLNDTTQAGSLLGKDSLLQYSDVIQNINASEEYLPQPEDDAIIGVNSLYSNPEWMSEAFSYINNTATKRVEYHHDWQSMAIAPYIPTEGDIIAPIGYDSDGNVLNFQMDVNKGHYHAFVIGATGSGKSRFLHNVILSMTTQYSPEDLELYLMDFKGVEFNCYRQLKHARAILVDRADERITYEVIRDLRTRMEERQRQLAEDGSSDVQEYNRNHPEKHLSQIILIADECQTLFGDRAKNGKLQNEIVDILALVAQQGRAYGVHLLLATQSLANTPQLGKEILNQISEHYILPCLPADAMRLVDDTKRSATEKIVATMEKGKGQCYYQGAAEDVFFTYNYVDKQTMQSDLVNAAIKKAEAFNSNGQAFFSGTLQFELNGDIAQELSTKGRKNIVASPGKEISLMQQAVAIPLKLELSENILLMGINDEEYLTRTTMGILTSLMLSNQQKDLGYQFIVFDCLNEEEAEYVDLLDGLEQAGCCKVVSARRRGEILKQLCDQIAEDKATPTILLILGQEKFRELKLNQEIADAPTTPIANDFQSALDMMNSMSFGGSQSSSKPTIKTIGDALHYILTNGPEAGVHTIMQLDKPEHFLFPQDGYFRKQELFRLFKHLILLRSDEMVASQLMLRDDIRLHTLERDPRRVRAYYYNEEADKYTLLTPYMLPDVKTIIQLTNQ